MGNQFHYSTKEKIITQLGEKEKVEVQHIYIQPTQLCGTPMRMEDMILWYHFA